MNAPEFFPVLTQVGRDAVATAQVDGRALPITTIAIGTSSYEPDGTETGLAAEQDRASISRREYMGDGVWRVAATIEGTSNYIAWEAAFFIEDDGQTIPLFVMSSQDRSFTAVSEGAKTTIELHIALGVLPEGSVEITVLDADPLQYNVLDDMAGVHEPGNNFNFALTRNIEEHMYTSMEQFEMLAQVRRGYGQSGVRMGRHYTYGGDAAYHRPSAVSFAAFGVHNHPNYPLMCGMPEITAIVNGYEVNTRHIDYRVVHSIGGNYLAVEDAVPPSVPASVAAQATPEDQMTEMREYLRAFGAKDPSIRDYRPHVDTYLSTIEVWLEELNGDELVDTFPSFRHQLSKLGHKKMNDDYMTLLASGLKSRFENDDMKPTVIRVMRPDGSPQMAVLRYRVSAVRLGTYAEYPVHEMVSQVDDVVTRVGRGTTDAGMAASRLGRFRVNHAIGDASLALRRDPGLLDEIMGKVPGLDGLGATINENYTDTDTDYNPFVQRLMDFQTTDLMNSAFYSRFYSYELAGAAGRRGYRFGYNDPMLFRAASTQDQVVALPGMGGGHRLSWSIPLELIVATPLSSWNPYDVPEGARAGITGNGSTQATAFSRSSVDGRWYRTPSVLFDGDGGAIDPADTDDAAWMMCGDGEARLMRGSGVYIHMPEMQGIQTARIRYPIAPVHHEGSFEFGHFAAVQQETRDFMAVMADEITNMKHTAKYGGNG